MNIPTNLVPCPEVSARQPALTWALAASLLIHALALLMPNPSPSSSVAAAPRPRLEARLGPPSPPRQAETAPPASAPVPATPAATAATRAVSKPQARSRVMTANKGRIPAGARIRQASPAESQEISRFLDDLAVQAKAKPAPTLSQRSLAVAREQGRELARQDEATTVSLERRPNSAPPEPFSLNMYVEGLLKRLNRSAAFVKNDPRNRGMHKAAVLFRLNPDGSLKSFVVLNAADQGEEIAFIKSVIERSLPFAAFPPDINRAASSLAMTICILPPGTQGESFGFSRSTDGKGC